MIHVLNFGHPLTPAQLEQLGAMLGRQPESVREAKVHLDIESAFEGQIRALVDGLGLSPADWQAQNWVVVLPALSAAAGVLLAELHGRMGHFPSIVRLKAVVDGATTSYAVAEVINLNLVRMQARASRAEE